MALHIQVQQDLIAALPQGQEDLAVAVETVVVVLVAVAMADHLVQVVVAVVASVAVAAVEAVVAVEAVLAVEVAVADSVDKIVKDELFKARLFYLFHSQFIELLNIIRQIRYAVKNKVV